MNIKHLGLDLFINFHPKIMQLKKESKQLFKNLKKDGLSIIQCKDFVAQKHGFSNWYQFIETIKNFYKKDIKKIPFLITKSNDKSINSKTSQVDTSILMGQDINFNHHIWQSKASLLTHHMILGNHIYNKYDLYLIKQAIQSNIPFIFFNGDGDIESIKVIASEISKNNSSLNIFNFTDKIIEPQYEKKFLDNFQMSSKLLIHMFYKLVKSDDKNDIQYNDKSLTILSILMEKLTYERNTKSLILNLNTIKNHLDIYKISELLFNVKVTPQTVDTPLIVNINISEPANYYNFIEEYSPIVKKLSIAINKLIESNMFSNDGIPFENIFDDNFIFQFNKDSKKENIFILNMMRTAINEKANISTLNTIFIRNCYIPQDFIHGPARSYGISLTFSYSSISDCINKNGYNATITILANTLTKIFAINEQEKETLKLFNETQQKFNEIKDSLVNVKNLSINMPLPKSDNIWIFKQNYYAQLFFK